MTAVSLPLPPSPALHRLSAAVLAVLFVAWLVSVWNAPVDSVQGVIQKVLYVHVPCAFAAYLGFALTALFGALYLWKRDERFDHLSASAASVGVLFCTLVILTGPVWAKGTWGRWWSWDLRLTLTLLLYLVYLSYILLRSFTEGNERTARFAAVYSIAGLAVIPLNYFAIDLAGGRAIHPDNLERDSLGAGMGMPFLLGTLTAFAAFFFLWLRRAELVTLRAELARRDAEQQMASGGGSWAT